MKLLLTSLLLITVINSFIYPQFEFGKEDNINSFIKEEKLISNGSTRFMDPETLDSIIISTMETKHIPGLTALIVKHDSIIWSRSYGYANVALNQPVEDSTLFLMGSLSKAIMGTALMQLWEDGLITSLDDNINDYLQPELEVINPYFPNDTITIKMLMTHTSSLNDNWDILWDVWCCGDSPIPLDSFLINYFTPGGIYYSYSNFNTYSPSANIWDYCNAATGLEALIIENLSGMPFYQYCQENIFDTLGMDKSSWFLEGLDTSQIATPYRWIGGQYVALCHQGWPLYPVGFLRTNKLELEHFLSAFMNWGVYKGNKILDSSTVSLMLSVHKLIDPSCLTYCAWGLNWLKVLWNGKYLWGRGGSAPGAATVMLLSHEEDWGFITFSNVYPPEDTVMFNAIIDYASEFGDIYAINTKIDKPYMRTSNDSIIVRTEFSNFNQHEFTANAIFINSDSSFVDSVALYDDGLHGDSLANDGIWGGFIYSIAEEDYYDLGISTLDTDNSKYFYSENLKDFTTVGPVILFDYEITSSNTTSGVSDTIHYVLTLQNQSNEKTVLNISTTLKSLDTLYQVSGLVNYGNIAPGETSIGTGYHTVIISNQIPPNTLLPVEIRITSDSVFYWLDTLDIITDIKEFVSLPKDYSLSHNFPNPFNPITSIKYSIPRESNVRLEILNILGEQVELLVNETKSAGFYKAIWNASNVSSGIYFYRIQAGDFIETKKMILLK